MSPWASGHHVYCETVLCREVLWVWSMKQQVAMQGRAWRLYTHVPSVGLPVLDLRHGGDPEGPAPGCPGLCPASPHATQQTSQLRPCQATPNFGKQLQSHFFAVLIDRSTHMSGRASRCDWAVLDCSWDIIRRVAIYESCRV